MWLKYFLLIKAKWLAVLSMVTTTHLWSASRYNFTLRSHDTGFVCLNCIFCLSFLIFSFTVVKTDPVQCVSVDASNLFFFPHISFRLKLLMHDPFPSRLSWKIYCWVLYNLDPWLKPFLSKLFVSYDSQVSC